MKTMGRMAELVDAHDSKSCFARSRVRFSLRPPSKMKLEKINNLIDLFLRDISIKERKNITYKLKRA